MDRMREHEIAVELGIQLDKADAFLSRIREEQEAVAWMHCHRRESDVVTSAVKHVWGKVAVGSLAEYSIPLFTTPPAAPDCDIAWNALRAIESIADGGSTVYRYAERALKVYWGNKRSE